ncbi:hypothetical protein T459_31910 [Capsicum annuum]|uniref:RNase H type-1 domain-containing protein n=1 Tax=Capsicum annuum TaxID=4072 RepID=A0A2G2Y3E9_CAPAN|nr:hypothetical protein T459_31910 [Capsicum annuum]
MSPPMSFFKLKIDGSAGLQPGTGGIGGIFRDHIGSWQLGFSEHLHHSTPILAEILTLRKGLIIAKQHQLIPPSSTLTV